MRKISLLLACLISSLLLCAQTVPSVNFTFTVSQSIATVNFTNTSQNLGEGTKKAFWSFGDGSSAITGAYDGSSHHYASVGTYQVCLKVFKYNSSIDSVLVGSECKSVTIEQHCEAGFQWADSVSSATAVHYIKFYGAANNNAGKRITDVCWNFGDGTDTCIHATAGAAPPLNIVHRYAHGGTYTVCIKVTFDGGCVAEKCNSVSVSQTSAECSFDLSEAAVNTASLERRFYVGLMPNRAAEKICWHFGDGTDTCVVLASPLNPQQLMIVHRYPAPGNYTVCAKVTYAGGCTAERCRPVSIALVHTNVCGGYMADSSISLNTVRFKGTGIQNAGDNVVSYNWTFGDGTTGAGQTVSHTFASPGRYNVCLYLKTSTGCETRICNPIGVSGANQPQLILTPNPVVNVLNATFVSLFQQTVTVKVYNANGLMIRSYVRSANMGTNNWTFSDVGTLPTGVYSVIVQSANQFATAIFFKQ
jgi:PKD repeat protein